MIIHKDIENTFNPMYESMIELIEKRIDSRIEELDDDTTDNNSIQEHVMNLDRISELERFRKILK